MSSTTPGLDVTSLRQAIQVEYAAVAKDPRRGFHFLVGRPLAHLLGYDEGLLNGIPESSIESFAGTGNPFTLGRLAPGERVVDIGCGAGIDTLIAARMVGPTGRVIGVDMTRSMLAKARAAAQLAGFANVDFRESHAESLPVDDSWADVVTSNGVLNLLPDKDAGLREIARVLKPGGRLHVADILVQRPLPDAARLQIDLWIG